MAALIARRAGRRLRIAGPLSDPHYFREQLQPLLGDGVEHVGHLMPEELAHLVGGSAVCLVTPDWEEPFGLVATEAMACGSPVLALQRGGLREVVRPPGRHDHTGVRLRGRDDRQCCRGTQSGGGIGWQRLAQLDLIMVDVSVDVSLLSRLHGVPTVALAMRGDRGDPAHRLAYDSATSLLVPWSREFPEQWRPDRWTDKARFVGAISRFDDCPPPLPQLAGSKHRVLVMLGMGGHDMPPEMLADAAARTPDWEWTLRSADTPSPDVWQDLLRSDVVVDGGSRPAHSACGSSVPSDALRRAIHGEQVAIGCCTERGALRRRHTVRQRLPCWASIAFLSRPWWGTMPWCSPHCLSIAGPPL